MNLNKLNIVNICEEILNPSVPMALRLSGILMGGVVIVYERKVKLFYEDVTHLVVGRSVSYLDHLVEIQKSHRVAVYDLSEGLEHLKKRSLPLQKSHRVAAFNLVFL